MADSPDTEAIAAERAPAIAKAIELLGKREQTYPGLPSADAPLFRASHVAKMVAEYGTLLAALATAEERRDQAEFQAEKYGREALTLRNQCVSLDERRERSEAVVEAAERWQRTPTTATITGLETALANYHKATGPQATGEGS